jgi:hypothetical protein
MRDGRSRFTHSPSKTGVNALKRSIRPTKPAWLRVEA